MTIQAGMHEKGTPSLSHIIRGIKDGQDFRKAGAIALFIGEARGETLKGEKFRN